MPLPGFQDIMLPLLKLTRDDIEHSLQQDLDTLVAWFGLSEQEVTELIPTQTQTRFYNRIIWAKTYLFKSRLLEFTRRSHYRITERGKQALEMNPERIDIHFLEQYPEFIQFRAGGQNPNQQPTADIFHDTVQITPEEALEAAYQEIRSTLAQDLLAIVKKCSPAFFERLVVELLVKMGYGGSWQEAARAVGQTGDEGIDGIIDEDRLGLDTIYIQAKRWENVIGRPEIHKFVGALTGRRAKRGIFITTSHFTSEAVNYVSNIELKVVLIDGKKLADFMIEYNIGVSGTVSYQLKRIYMDYFQIEN